MMLIKFQFIIFYALLLFLPVNLGRHFFFDFSSVQGIYVDYLIPTLYLTDLLIGLLLLFWLIEAISRPLGSRKPSSATSAILFLFLIATGASVIGAGNQPAAIYKWLKLCEFSLFAFWLATHIEWKRDLKKIVAVIAISLLGESLLALAQWFRNGSIFGYAFFGEQPFTALTPGIAQTSLLGEKHIRPYGTFTHPNVLGGYLSISLTWLLISWFGGQNSDPKTSQGDALQEKTLAADGSVLQNFPPTVFYGWRFIILVFGLSALFLTFSRTAWVALGLGFTLIGLKKFTTGTMFRRILLTAFIIISLSWLVFQFVPNLGENSPERNQETADLSIVRRRELNSIALAMLRDRPLLGVGLNNFTVAMDGYGHVSGLLRFLQPAHNIFLLIGAETGLFGLTVFILLWLLALKKSFSAAGLFALTFIQLFWLGLFDHYLFTLQSGLLLFWLSLGLAFSSQRN